MRHCLPLLILLAGCKADPDAALLGTWTTGKSSIAFTGDKKYAAEIGGASITGAWVRTGQKVALTPATYNGKPVAEQAAQLEKSIARLRPGMKSQAKALVDSVRAVHILTLSDDGKTLSATEGMWTGMSMSKKVP